MTQKKPQQKDIVLPKKVEEFTLPILSINVQDSVAAKSIGPGQGEGKK